MTAPRRSARQPARPGQSALRHLCQASFVAVALLLSACGSVAVKPAAQLPRPLIQPMPARVGLVLTPELRNYRHEEKRGNSTWKIELGAGHEELFRTAFGASFAAPQVFDSLDAARSAQGLQAMFVPVIEQYSFVTDSETGGEFWAVTIRYRIGVLGPAGETVDNLTLTGYGSARRGRAATAMTNATQAAMRDAAAKFLVQLPRQPLAAKLATGAPLGAEDAAAAQKDVVEVVPIAPVEP
jgi:hypothetical protein